MKRNSLSKLLRCIACALVALVIALAVAVFALWHNELTTLASFQKLSDRDEAHRDGAVYQINFSGDYFFDEFLSQGGASNDAELISFVTRSITKGIIPMHIKTSSIACSAFTADTQSGDRVFGRNYDFSATNTAIVYTNPGEGRHASYSTIDLSFLGLDADKDVETIGQKFLTLAAPYVPLDGINDAGVACGIFMSYQGEGKGTPTDTQTDRPDITSTTLLRLILDYADSVEDAVALAQQYDLHDSASSCFHYMVADSTGRSAILEWVGTDADHDADGAQRQLNVLWNDTDALSDSADWQVVTNFIKTPGYYDGTSAERKGLDRYEHLAAALRETDGIVADKDAAMDLLASVGRRTWNNDDSNSNTVHSVVYDLTDKSVLWVGNEHYGEVTSHAISAGRDISAADCSTRARDCVIGETLRKYFFGAMSPIGQKLQIGGKGFEVIGVYAGKYDGKLNTDDQILVMPYTLQSTMMRVYGMADRQYIVKAAEKDVIAELTDELLPGFMQGRCEAGNGYFSASSDSQWQEQSESSNNMLALLGGGVAGISLLVGGIGIMNIMLVSVTERTREIGIRMAIGARKRDIIGQFLVEASVVSCCGGVIGIVLGCFLSAVLGNLLLAKTQNSYMPTVEQFTVLPSAGLVIGAFLFSALLGIIFGLYPANKASNLQPVDALRTQ